MNPPLADHLDWILALARRRLSALGPRRERRPMDMRERIVGEGRRRMCVRSDGWVLTGRDLSLRWARVQTAVADVATIMIMPIAESCTRPVYGLELVVIGDSCTLAVLDVHPAAIDPVLTRALDEKLGTSPLEAAGVEVREQPEWFAEIASSRALCASFPVDRMGVVAAEADRILTATILLWAPPETPGHEDAAVAAYKHHHAVHSPGRPMMTPKFGAAWTGDFLDDWHFGPIRELEPESGNGICV